MSGDAGGGLVLTAWCDFKRLRSFVTTNSALKVFLGNHHATTQPSKNSFAKRFAWHSGGDIPAIRSCLFSEIKCLSSPRGKAVPKLFDLRWVCLVAGNAHAQLTLSDVQTVVAQAVTRATALANSPLKTNAVIAVTDREGWVLGVWALNTNATSASPLVGEAIAKAGTAAF